MYIYSNVCAETLVGDSYVKLLRTTPSDDFRYRDLFPTKYATKTFVIPHYIPIASSFENNIEIGITTDEGVNFGFIGGKVIITLHSQSS